VDESWRTDCDVDHSVVGRRKDVERTGISTPFHDRMWIVGTLLSRARLEGAFMDVTRVLRGR